MELRLDMTEGSTASRNENQPANNGVRLKNGFEGPWFEETIAENPAWRNQADGFVE